MTKAKLIDNETMKYEDTSSDNQSCFEKISLMGPGSIKGCVFNLSILCVGVGCLNLPQRLGQMSVVLCFVLMILAGIISYNTLLIIMKAGNKIGALSYTEVIRFYCGEAWSKYANVTIMISITGFMILCQITSKWYIKQFFKYITW